MRGASLTPVLHPLSTSFYFACCWSSQLPSHVAWHTCLSRVPFLLLTAWSFLPGMSAETTQTLCHLYRPGPEGLKPFRAILEQGVNTPLFLFLWINPQNILRSFSEGPQWARSPTDNKTTSSIMLSLIGFPSFSVSLSQSPLPTPVFWAQFPKYTSCMQAYLVSGYEFPD